MIPVFIRDRLRSLLVPELADLRQQLADARRLAGEAQGRFREAANVRDQLASQLSTRNDEAVAEAHERDRLACELARVKAELNERHAPLLGPLAMERDQLRARVAELEATRDKVEWCLPLAASNDDDRIQVHACPLCKGVKPSRVAERICPADIGHKRGCAYAPTHTVDGQPITYVDQLRARVAELEAELNHRRSHIQ